MNKRTPILLLALTGTMLSLSPAYSATRTWAVSSGSWTTPSNWTGTAVPTTADIALINNSGTAIISTAVDSITRLNVGGTNSGHLLINSGGSLSVTDSNRVRISDGNNFTASVTLNGGNLSSTGAIYVGLGNSSTATLTVSNGGTASSTSNILMASSSTNTQSVINIGGASTAAAAGYISANSIIGYVDTGVTTNTLLNFNHTSSRYTFTKGAASSDVTLINGTVHVNAKAGVTVLTGSNNYSRGTEVWSGGVLLANYVGSGTAASSTGTGAVTVDAGGVLGGVGYILGATTVSGTLKPGDYDYNRSTDLHGILTFGNNLTLNDGSFTEIAIDGLTRGTGYDAINVAGNLALNGTLVLNLLDGFSIAEDETLEFTIFQVTGGYSGAFDGYVLPTSWSGMDLEWDTDSLATNGILSVTAVPEPSVAFLVCGGLGLLALRRRMKRQSAA